MTRFKALAVAVVASTVVLLGAPADAAPASGDDVPIVGAPGDAPTARVDGWIVIDRDTGWDCPGC